MKFAIALLLVIASVHASSLHRYGWTPGKESVYKFESQVLNGIPEINHNTRSGLKLSSQIRVQSYSDYSLRIKMENVKFITLNGETKLTESGRLQGRSGSESGHLPEEFRRHLEEPFLAYIKGGVITSFKVSTEEPTSVTNIKRSVLAQLQLDVSGSQRSQIESNHIQLPTPEESVTSGLSGESSNLSGMPYFSTQEESVHGKCKTSYTIHKIPAFKVKELEEQWSKEEQELKGGLEGEYSQSSTESLEQSRSEQGEKHCNGKTYYQILKTKDFDHCDVSPIFQKFTGPTGKCNLNKPSTCTGLLISVSTSTYYVCGELSQFQIRKITTKNDVRANPLGTNTDESNLSSTIVSLDLVKVKSITERLPIPSSTKEESSLVYAYPSQSELRGQISEETVKKSIEILGVKPILPQPTLTEAPKSLIPTITPKEQIKTQVFEQLKKMASEVSESPESCSSKSDIAGSMSSVAQFLRYLSLSELEHLESMIKSESRSEGQELTPLEKLFWDTITSVGTNPSTMLVIKKVKEGSLPTGKVETMIQHTLRNVRYPTEQLLSELVKMAKHETVKSNKYLLTTTIGNLANLFYRGYVNPSTMINNFPSQVYGVFGTKESVVLTEEFIPYLISLAEGSGISGSVSGPVSVSTKHQLQYSAIVSLGRTGHLKAVKTLLKAAEGKLEHLESSQTSGSEHGLKEALILRPLAVHSLKRIAKMNPQQIKPLLMAIIENPIEAPEVRTAAVAILPYTMPTPTDIQAIAIRTWFEPSRQVATFIRTTLISLINSEVPEFKTLSVIVRNALPLMKNEDFGFLFSRNVHFNKFVQYLQTGVVSEIQVQKSKRSMTPVRMAGSTEYYGNHGTFKLSGLSWEMYMQGMDKLVEKYIQYFTFSGKTTESTKTMLEKISEKLGVQTRGFQPTQFFGTSSFMGISFDSFLDTETVMQTIGKLTRQAEEETEKSISFNTVGGAIWHEVTGLGMTDAGFPVLASVASPVVWSAKGNVKAIQTGPSSLPEVEASLIPVINIKVESHHSIISPFTQELIGSGVEAAIHSSIPISIKAKITENELNLTIKNPTEGSQENGRDTETLHGFVLPYTFKKTLWSVKPTSKSSSLTKIISGTPTSVEIPIGKSVGLSGRLMAESNNVYVDLASYLEKIRQTSLSSLATVIVLPSSVRMSSTKVKYSPSQSETKEILLSLSLRSQDSKLSKVVQGEEVVEGFKSVKSVLEQIKSSEHGQATLLSLTATSKGGYSPKTLKSSLIVGKTTEQNGKITKTYAALNYKTGTSGSEVYGIKYEGKATVSQPITRWNLEKLISEELKGEFTAHVTYGKTSEESKVLISGNMKKSEEQKKNIRESPEYKMCKVEETKDRKLSEICREVRLQATSLDKFEIEVQAPETLAKSTLVTLVKEMIESSLMGQISVVERSSSSVSSVSSVSNSGLKVSGTVDRTGHVAQVKVQTPSGQTLLVKNIRLYGYTKNILPLSVHNSLGSTLTQKLSLNRVPLTCTVEPKTITTFDNKTYGYELNNCEHVLLQDGSKYVPISVLSRSLEQGSLEKEVRIISGESEVKVTPQGGSIKILVNGKEITTLSTGEIKKIMSPEGSFVMVEIKKYQDNTYLINFPQQSLSVVTDGKRIEIVGSSLVMTRAVGLCGDMNGESTTDLKSPKKCVMTPTSAAVSYILNKSGSSSSSVSPRCEGIPSQYRQKYEKESQECLKELVIPTPLTTIYSHVNLLSLSQTKSHVVDKQTGQTCVSKEMLKTCLGKPLKIRQRSVEFTCVSRPSRQAETLEKRALAGEVLSEVKTMPTSFRRVEFEPVMCSTTSRSSSVESGVTWSSLPRGGQEW